MHKRLIPFCSSLRLRGSSLHSYIGTSRQPVRLTPAFIDRIFSEITTYQTTQTGSATPKEGEMDYKTFLDFVLAMENKKTKEGLRYFWRLITLPSRPYLDSYAINFFFRDITRTLIENNIEPANAMDVKDEIFDMVKVREMRRSTTPHKIFSL